MHWYGIYFYFDGDKYEGDWVDDKNHGKGTKYYSNGDKYAGDLVDNKMAAIFEFKFKFILY